MACHLVTVANETYHRFLRLFVHSLFDLPDAAEIGTLFVLDTGLSAAIRRELRVFDKLTFVDAGFEAPSSSIHDEGWQRNTYAKAEFLLEILKTHQETTFMVDVDSLFAAPFLPVLDREAEIVVCRRKKEGFSHHIGSFFGAIEPGASIPFVEQWIAEIERLRRTTGRAHCESPALSRMVEVYQERMRIQELPEQVISAVYPDDPETRIFHLKSDWYAMSVEERLGLPQAAPFVARYEGQMFSR